MKPNVNEIQKLVDNVFRGNKAAFAKAIGTDRSHVSHILNTGTGAGAQFFGGLISFCEKNELDFRKFIFLPESVKILYENDKSNA
ncbi:hypothetical protein [Wukongibacter baidiensis]